MDCGPDVRDSITMSACFLQKRKIQNRLVEDMIWKAPHVFQYSFTHSRNFLYKGRRRKKNKKHQFAITMIRTVYIGSLKPVSSDEGMKVLFCQLVLHFSRQATTQIHTFATYRGKQPISIL